MRTPALPGFANSRDLGGIPAGSDGSNPSGFVRSNTPVALTAEDLRTALEFGFVRVLDLRSASEVERVPHPLSLLAGYRHLPLIDPRAEQHRDAEAEKTLADIYRGSVERNTATIAAIMRAIADAPAGPILISCSAGKDRTGMISAMLLDLAGAPRPAISADYACSEPRMRSDFDRELALADDAASRQKRRALQNSDPDNVLAMLEHLQRNYGSVAGYLSFLGLSAEQIERIRQRVPTG
jgi:protein-tyrosine phosphatase